MKSILESHDTLPADNFDFFLLVVNSASQGLYFGKENNDERQLFFEPSI